jgi:type IV pilus assembly protein PilA
VSVPFATRSSVRGKSLDAVPRPKYDEVMQLGEAARGRIEHSRSESGFTLPELLIVVTIIGVLLAIAVPSYLGHRERAEDVGARAAVRQAVPALEAYYQDHGTYTGATPTVLRAGYDAGLPASLVTANTTPADYCAQATFGGTTWSLTASDGEFRDEPCSG